MEDLPAFFPGIFNQHQVIADFQKSFFLLRRDQNVSNKLLSVTCTTNCLNTAFSGILDNKESFDMSVIILSGSTRAVLKIRGTTPEVKELCIIARMKR